MTRILEGTWAEISAHQDEWNGRRLRVEVQATPAENVAPENNGTDENHEPTLLELLGDVVGSVEGMPEDLGANHKKYYAQAMDEKYGLKAQ